MQDLKIATGEFGVPQKKEYKRFSLRLAEVRSYNSMFSFYRFKFYFSIYAYLHVIFGLPFQQFN